MKNFFMYLAATMLLCFEAGNVLAQNAGTAVRKENAAVLVVDGLTDVNGVMLEVFTDWKAFDFLDVEFKDGRFEKTVSFPDTCIDLMVINDDDDDDGAGVTLYPGDTMRLHFAPAAGGGHDVVYEGLRERESRIVTDWAYAYGMFWRYNIRPDMDTAMSSADALRLLAENDAAFRAKHGAGLEPRLAQRGEMYRQYLYMLLVEFSDYDDRYRDSGYVSIVESIDPNDNVTSNIGMLNRWAGYVSHNLGDSEAESTKAFMEQYMDKVTSPLSRKTLASYCASPIVDHPERFTDESAAAYVEMVKNTFPDHPEAAKKCAESYKAYKQSMPGMPMPDAELLTPDGKKVMLSSMYGKVVYIDLWATWCGPCVKEIPFMEKLAERFKDDGEVVLISISTDDSDEPWLRKIEKDKPAWPQYRMSREEYAKFAPQLNIHAIPRFIIVGRDGKIVDANAPRPSDEKVDAALKKAKRAKP